MMSEAVKLITTRPDAEVAAEIKKDVANKLLEVCELANLAQDAGLTVNFSIAKDWRGKNVISLLTVVKMF